MWAKHNSEYHSVLANGFTILMDDLFKLGIVTLKLV